MRKEKDDGKERVGEGGCIVIIDEAITQAQSWQLCKLQNTTEQVKLIRDKQ